MSAGGGMVNRIIGLIMPTYVMKLKFTIVSTASAFVNIRVACLVTTMLKWNALTMLQTVFANSLMKYKVYTLSTLLFCNRIFSFIYFTCSLGARRLCCELVC